MKGNLHGLLDNASVVLWENTCLSRKFRRVRFPSEACGRDVKVRIIDCDSVCGGFDSPRSLQYLRGVGVIDARLCQGMAKSQLSWHKEELV